MGLSLVTAPTTEPITLGEARAHLRIDGAESDGILAGYIVAARHWAEGYTHKALMLQTWDYTIDFAWPFVPVAGYWSVPSAYLRTRIELPLPPHKLYLNTATSPISTASPVVSVSYVDGNGNTQVLPTNQYTVVLGGPFGYIEPAYGVTWPDIRCQPAAITVRMVCGFGPHPGDVPEDLRTAMLMHIEMMYDRDPQTQSLLETARDNLISGNQAIRA